MKTKMDPKYLYNSLKKNYDNENLIKEIKVFKDRMTNMTLSQAEPKNITRIHIDLEQAMQENKLDYLTFQLIYYYLKFLSEMALFHVGQNPNFEYVITVTFSCSLGPNQIRMTIDSMKKILDILWPECSDIFRLRSEITDPYTHVSRVGEWANKAFDPHMEADEFDLVQELVVSGMSVLSAEENDSAEDFKYTYKYKAFGLPVWVLGSDDDDLYKEITEGKQKPIFGFCDCSPINRNCIFWNMLAILIDVLDLGE
ncbi:MAG: hypothetical protein K5773_03725 [Pseudobutyrivibrio sp.]|nr:hypothetical protein [Pseudobutyrivibrio sp.]